MSSEKTTKKEDETLKENENDSRFKEQIIDISEIQQNNRTENFQTQEINNNQTSLEKIEEKIMRAKLEAALKTLDELNKNAKNILNFKNTPDKILEFEPQEINNNKNNKTQTIH